jgi:hypothetical protein
VKTAWNNNLENRKKLVYGGLRLPRAILPEKALVILAAALLLEVHDEPCKGKRNRKEKTLQHRC